jgi:hypothetical protein
VPVLVLAVLVILAFIALIPLSFIQRLRMGTSRRQARGWVATLNMIAVGFSVVLFLVGAFITSRWIPDALTYTLAGLGAGCVLGVLGVALTKWEYAGPGRRRVSERGLGRRSVSEGDRLYYTPNRWLVVTVTMVVAARVLYGFWRTWEAWRASVESMTWVAASGVAASMSAGAVVLGYYLVFWTGVRWRIRRLTSLRDV